MSDFIIPRSEDPAEVNEMISHINERSERQPQRILEIGQYNGYNFDHMVRAFVPDVAVGIDYPGITSQWQDVESWIIDPRKIDKISEHLKFLAKRLNEGDELLDAGCYGGYLYSYLTKQYKLEVKYTGIDLFGEALEEAKAFHPKGIDLRQQDAYTVKGAWDVVVAMRLLMHVPDPKKLALHLATCARREFLFMVPFAKKTLPQKQKIKDGGEYLFWQFGDDELHGWGAENIFRSDRGSQYTVWKLEGSAK